MPKNLIFILYDSIFNSVFQSQVLQPLITLLTKDKNLKITLISFEKTKPADKSLINLINQHPRLNLLIKRKLPFFSKWTLYFAIFQIKNLLKNLNDSIMARGPLAGFISLKCVKQQDVIIQARGLAAQEYRFANKNPGIKYKQIYNSLKNIEKYVYSNRYPKLKIESVSPALKEYLIKTFNADESKIYIAQNDLPKKINPDQIQTWKKEVRSKLKIPTNHKVYIYSGSSRPWQCASQSITYFKNNYLKNNTGFLLILSQDKSFFEQEIAKQNIAKQNYCVISVKPNDVYKYLATADFGLLFRDKDIINWVSRPTKMLEYEAVGLEIIHNNTIAWLAKKKV